MDIYKDCTEECEKEARCLTCGRIKVPFGRDAGLDNGMCDWDCPGYRQKPLSRHLWPGELKRIREAGL